MDRIKTSLTRNMPKRISFIILALVLGLALAPRIGRAAAGTSLTDLTRSYAYQIGSFNVSWSNVLSTVKSRLLTGMTLKPSAWCQYRMKDCDTTYAHAAARCAPKKTICLASPNSSATFCDQLLKTCRNQALLDQTKCKKVASLDARCWLVVAQKTCQGATSRQCTMVTGEIGVQNSTGCNAQTGQWNWSECKAKVPAALAPLTALVAAPPMVPLAAPVALPLIQPVTTLPLQTCQGSQPACSLGYVGSYTCVNGNWQNNCQMACTQPPSPCPTGWSGSQSCLSSGGNSYAWVNTCEPSGMSLCYKGVKYIMNYSDPNTPKAYANCVGSGYYDGSSQFCLKNDCGASQPWNYYGTEAEFKAYADNVYAQYTQAASPATCNTGFQYAQCL